jgi:hypothetical protein
MQHHAGARHANKVYFVFLCNKQEIKKKVSYLAVLLILLRKPQMTPKEESNNGRISLQV